MNINFFLLILTLAQLCSCSAQSKRIEEKLMECTFQSYEDAGAEFQILISSYESLLINEGFLDDGSGKSYHGILKKLANGRGFEKEPTKFFYLELQKIKQGNLIKVKECHAFVLSDSLNTETKRLFRFFNVFDPKNPNTASKSNMAQQILKILDVEDFELPFYKLHVFLLFSWIDTEAGLSKIKTEDLEPVVLQSALRVAIDANGEIYVNDVKTFFDEFKVQVRNYEKSHTSKSVIVLKTHRSTLYRTYIKVIKTIEEEIQLLRDDMAKQKYNKNFDQLTEKEQTEVAANFPIKLVDEILD
ncbi:biopolymer transporter ExbD [Flagellimonas beolgyonensis]|uniref:biopolymer transporter ExbD n=1 Tax=Flagellimonas beolgyonensis TaxID=864064 RepID=UPI003D64EB3D